MFLIQLIVVASFLIESSLSEELQSFTYVCVDVYCATSPTGIALDGTNITCCPYNHTVGCMRDVPVCRTKGACLMENLGTYGNPNYTIQYYLDSVGSNLTLALLDQTSTKTNFILTVQGTVGTNSQGNLTVFVTSLAEPAASSQITWAGIVADCYCARSPTGIAIDGTNMTCCPDKHTVACMKDVPVCKQHGYCLLHNIGTAANPNYQILYELDDYGNNLVLNIVDTTAYIDNFVLTITGVPAGRNTVAGSPKLFAFSVSQFIPPIDMDPNFEDPSHIGVWKVGVIIGMAGLAAIVLSLLIVALALYNTRVLTSTHMTAGEQV